MLLCQIWVFGAYYHFGGDPEGAKAFTYDIGAFAIIDCFFKLGLRKGLRVSKLMAQCLRYSHTHKIRDAVVSDADQRAVYHVDVGRAQGGPAAAITDACEQVLGDRGMGSDSLISR